MRIHRMEKRKSFVFPEHIEIASPEGLTLWDSKVKATFHLTISLRDQRATGKIQRNNYRHGSCGPSLKGKTSSVSLIFTHGTHRNVKNR